MQITYWIDKTKVSKKGAAPIMITITYHGQRSRYSSGLKIEPKYWNELKQQVKNTFDFSHQVNAKIQEWTTVINLAWYELMNRFDKVEKAEMEALIENLWKTWGKIKNSTSGDLFIEKKILLEHTLKDSSNVLTLSEFWDEVYISDHKRTLSNNYLRLFKPLKDHLFEFLPAADFDSLNVSTLHKFVNFLADEKDLSDNSISVYMRKLGAVLEYAYETGINVLPDFRRLNFGIYQADRVYLTWPEITHLLTFDFNEKDRMHIDQLLMACFTGFRYSDLIRLGDATNEYKHFSVFRLHQKKTKEQVSVAMNDYALEIWSRHEGKLFSKSNIMPMGYFSQAIKQIVQKAGIDTQIKVTEFKKGSLIESFVPKWKAISSHTGRHSFAVNSLEKGMSIEVLQKIMGHKSISSTQVYAKIIDDFKHQKMMDVWKKEP